MNNLLNPPQRVINNIQTATSRMRKMDKVLGVNRVQKFAQEVSRILYHTEPTGDGLCSVIESHDTKTEIVIQLINTATELETAWNVTRLGNIPASQRQGRVAHELIAVTVLMALPSSSIKGLPPEVPLARCLQKYPNKTVVDCYKNIVKEKGVVRKVDPLLKTTDFFTSFLMTLELLLNVSDEIVEAIRTYRKKVQHPASHGSRELFAYHFEAFDGRAAGAVFSQDRISSYVHAADDVINISCQLADILDLVVNYLRENELANPS